tara:strand:+ start:5453 stop:5797 length:345 start_codon:yes stop_codon:yes gene_type:complete
MGSLEGAPKVKTENKENVESLDDWRALKEGAEDTAKEMISRIPGYEDMSVSEKVSFLEELSHELMPDVSKSSKDEDGLTKVEDRYRYVRLRLAGEIAFLEETERHEKMLASLGR